MLNSTSSTISPELSSLEILRARVRILERGGIAHRWPTVPLGIEILDRALAGGGLLSGRVHEVIGEAHSEVRDAACFGFATALLIKILRARPRGGDVLWCPRDVDGLGGMLSARGLAGIGLDPGRVFLASARDEADRLWAMEEGLGCSGLAAVVGEFAPVKPAGGTKALVMYRRLQLAAEVSGVTGFMVRPDAGHSVVGNPETRWIVTALPSLDGRPRWNVELQRARNGRPAVAAVTWDTSIGEFTHDTAHQFCMTSPRQLQGEIRSAQRTAA